VNRSLPHLVARALRVEHAAVVDALVGREREVHGADGLVGAAAGGPGDAAYCKGERRARAPTRPERHLADGGGAHGAVALEGRGAHAELLDLGRVRVGDVAALEPARAAGDVGDARAE